MGAIVVGLRPDDYKRLHQIAEYEGRRPQDLAGIYLERAIRRAVLPKLLDGVLPTDDRLTTGSPATAEVR